MQTHWPRRIRAWLTLNQRGWRLLVGTICVIGLALFLHFREVRFEVLELNSTASRYVIAQVDFEFPDRDTTLILREQAMQDIGQIYQIDEQEIQDERLAIENQLIHDGGWRKAAPSSTFEEMYTAAGLLETKLFEARFASPRTIQKIRELRLSDVGLVGTLDGAIPSTFWERIASQTERERSFHAETIPFFIQILANKNWSLTVDEKLVSSLRAQAEHLIPEKVTFVRSGTRIIDQGERVTAKHLAMMQAMKQAISEKRRLYDPLGMIASLLLSIIFVTISALYFRISQPTFVRSLHQISLFVCVVILTLCFAKLTEFTLLKSSSQFVEAIRYPIVAPFATILICILISARTALFAATFLSIILSVSLAVDHSRFLVLNLVTSIVVIISTQGLRKRKEVFSVCLKSWGASIPVLIAYALHKNHFLSKMLLFDVGASLFFLLLTAILVIGLLPALETLFGVLTDITLLEYMDPNNELLKRLAVEVPGTYQHSLVLGTFAEQCAQAIGASGAFCRAATLYHDIGKIMNPQFYTENQRGNVNIHHLLTPLESAQVIISHVADGEILARKYRLPTPFIDIIREHHGTTLVYYFYRKQLELKGENVAEVDEKAFRYPGPKPRTKESAIIMICDTIEAASRSIEEISEASFTQLIDRLVAEKAGEGQFDDCQLTFEELSKVKKTLVQCLLLAQHTRVKYPKRP